MVDKKQSHKVFFSPLRPLFLSLIPTGDRTRLFPDADQPFSKDLVTTSVFSTEYWATLPASLRNALSSDRAWFGIRSLMNGGVLGHEVQYFSSKNFRQLGEIGGLQIPAKQSRNYFSDDELHTLINIQNRYETWKSDNNRYDELDIVKQATRHYLGQEKLESKARIFTEKESKLMGDAIGEAVDQSIQFGPNAQRFIKNRANDGEFSKKLYAWVDKVRKGTLQQRPLGSTRFGHTIYKSKIPQQYRVFTSYVRIPGVNGGNSHVYVHTICHTNDQNDVVNSLCNTLKEGEEAGISEFEAENARDYTDLGADAPVVPVPDVPESELEDFGRKITGANNLNLDDAQKRALAKSQPLLIDGLAGTGKTAVLAMRANIQLKHSAEERNLLVCASMGHVVDKLRKAIKELTHEARKNNEVKMDTYAMGIAAEGFGKLLELDAFSSTIPEEGFHEIILDECQDLTRTEFNLLLRLTKGKQAVRFSIAGDPMQTLNPTGFDWGAIKAMFREEMQGTYSEEELSKLVVENKFHRNYRSQSKIVQLNNGIQHHRSIVTGVTGVIMESGRPPLDYRPFLVSIKNDHDKELLVQTLKESGKGQNKAIIITWSTDDHDLENLLESDDVLSKVWAEFKGNDYTSEQGIRSKFLIHSASSIKGDEHETVILYKFLSNQLARKHLQSMQQPYESLKIEGDATRIAVAYAYSRLYVSLTRAFSHIVIVEDNEGYEFWRDLKLTVLGDNNERIQHDMFEEGSTLQGAINALSDIFESTIPQTRLNFHKYRNSWEQTHSIDALRSAINIGRKLLEDLEEQDAELYRSVHKLLGDLAWYNYTRATTDDDREKFLEEALHHYNEAELNEMIAPIRYHQRRWRECLDHLSASTIFERWVEVHCKLELNIAINQDIFNLEPPQTTPSEWNVGFVELAAIVKSLVFEHFYQTSFENENEVIFENHEWFGKEFLLDKIARNGKSNTLIMKMWNEYGDYDSSTAKIFAESIRIKVSNQVLESKISTIEATIKKFPRIGELLLTDLITHRKLWVFGNEGIRYTRYEGDNLLTKNAYSHKHVHAQVNDENIKFEVRERLRSLQQAYLLRKNLEENSDTESLFDGKNLRLKTTLEIIDEMEDFVLEKHNESYDSENSRALDLLRKISMIPKYAEFDKKGRFSWLNNLELYHHIVREMFNMAEKRKSSRNSSLGADRAYLPAGYLHVFANYELARSLSLYQDALEVLSYRYDLKTVFENAHKSLVGYLKKVVNEDAPLLQSEFNFLLACIRNTGNPHILAKSDLERLGFSDSQMRLYNLEKEKCKLGWPYDVEEGQQLGRKPAKFDEMIKLLKDAEESELVNSYLAALPVDWVKEFEKFNALHTYEEFWELLINLHQNPRIGKNYEKRIKHIGINNWVKMINQLDYPETLESDKLARAERREAFLAIQSLSEFPPTLASSSHRLSNPFFFLQYSDDINHFVANLAQIRSTKNTNDIDWVFLGKIIEDEFKIWGESLQNAHNSISKPTAAQEKEFMEKNQRITNLRAAIENDVQSRYEERIALGLRELTVEGLKEFATRHELEVTKTGKKSTIIASILSSLNLEKTVTGKYLTE